MLPSSRTPEGERNWCPVCRKKVKVTPSTPPGDAPCPYCGHLLWFLSGEPASFTLPADPPRLVWPKPAEWPRSKRKLSKEEEFELLVASALRILADGDHDRAIEMLSSAVRARPRDTCYRRLLETAELIKRHNSETQTVPDLQQWICSNRFSLNAVSEQEDLGQSMVDERGAQDNLSLQDGDAISSTRNRRHLRFSLRMLLLVLLIASIGMSWLAVRLLNSQELVNLIDNWLRQQGFR